MSRLPVRYHHDRNHRGAMAHLDLRQGDAEPMNFLVKMIVVKLGTYILIRVLSKKIRGMDDPS